MKLEPVDVGNGVKNWRAAGAQSRVVRALFWVQLRHARVFEFFARRVEGGHGLGGTLTGCGHVDAGGDERGVDPRVSFVPQNHAEHYRRFLSAALLVFGLTAPMIGQSVAEPPAYPDGQFCSPQGTVDGRGRVINRAPDHQCACHRHVEPSADDPVCETGYVHEDAKCLQFCTAKHCSCFVHCETPKDGQRPATR